MKTKHEQLFKAHAQRGNAMIYVLIAIVLFAALSMTLGRQTDTGEADDLDDGKAEFFATQLIAYATQTKSVIDQMVFSGTSLDNLDFTQPSQAGFNTAPTIHKVYHPDGGGLNPGKLPEGSTHQTTTNPGAGWYLGRFNNVEWTKTTGTDVMLVAFQIKKKICEKINQKITGNTDIPKMTDSIRATMIDASFYTGAANTDLTTAPGSPICAECHHKSSLCVEDSGGGIYGFYTVVGDR